MDSPLSKILLDSIKKLDYEQLHTLNHIVIERMKLFEKAKTISVLKKFQFYDNVYFFHKDKRYDGIITRLNQTTATIRLEDGSFWKVHPDFLKKSKKKNILKGLMAKKS